MAENSTNHSPEKIAQSPGSLLSWARLARVSNLPTAVSNILVGYLIAHQAWTPILPLILLVLASAMIYSAGMILNDVFDVEVDRIERPGRPIPAGDISLRNARLAGFGLLMLGAILPFVVSVQSGVISVSLSLCVWGYDGILKKTPVAPIVMGLCRTLNILMGASAPVIHGSVDSFFSFPALGLWYAASIGILIAGTTWFARNEASVEVDTLRRGKLLLSAAVIFTGLIGIGTANYQWESAGQNKIDYLFPFLILLISVTVIRRLIMACYTCQAGDIQGAIISILRSLIIFDAAICLFVAPAQPFYALLVVSFLLPCLVLSRSIRQT